MFVNYCLNCHSANLMRYNRLTDIGLDAEAKSRQNLLFATDKVGDTMTVAMRPEDAKAWFGAAPPDLSVDARARGKDWLYTYLRSFYRDDTRPTGWNNLRVRERRACRTCCGSLQGQRTAKFDDEIDEKTGEKVHKFRRLSAGHAGDDVAGRL